MVRQWFLNAALVTLDVAVAVLFVLHGFLLEGKSLGDAILDLGLFDGLG